VAAVDDEAGGAIVGTGGAAVYGDALAWVCMILVDPAHRGRGLGARLTAAVLERLRDARSVGLDATPAGRPVYAGLGFQDRAELRRMFRGPSASAVVADVESGVRGPVRPMEEGHLEAVALLDREVFGADRGPVLRWMRARAPRLAWIVEGDDGGPHGYCFGRPGDHSAQVGPVVAATAEAGRELLHAALPALGGQRVVVDVPAARADWLSFLADVGFREERPLTRMYRGAPPMARRAGLQLAILGPEFG